MACIVSGSRSKRSSRPWAQKPLYSATVSLRVSASIHSSQSFILAASSSSVSALMIHPLSTSAWLSWLQPSQSRSSSGRSLAKLPHSKKSPWLVPILPAVKVASSKTHHVGMRSKSQMASENDMSVCQPLWGEPVLFSSTKRLPRRFTQM